MIPGVDGRAGMPSNSSGANAAAAAASAAAALASQLVATAAAFAVYWDFDTSTSMADPGVGKIRLDNATVSSVTAIAVSAQTLSSGNPDLSAWIAQWGASTHSPRGYIVLKNAQSEAFVAVFSVTAAVTDNGTWLQITVSHIASAGSLASGNDLIALFSASGSDGSGDVTGPGGSTDNAIARFDSTTGKLLQNSAATLDDNGAPTFPANIQFTGIISPSQITADQDNYSPTGLSTAFTLRLSSDASRNITGLATGASGRQVTIVNIGSQDIVLKDESASSTAANRFALGGDITIAGDYGVILLYDGTSSRWRCIGTYVSGAGGAPTLQVFTAGGTWTKPAGLSAVIVQVQAGGGGGGGSSSTNSGGGGGGGGFSMKRIATGSLGATETVTIGSGGAGGVGNNPGSSGGTSSFGAHASGTGGTGGAGSGGSATAGGLGGSGSGGDSNVGGGGGGYGSINLYGPSGGSSVLGTGGNGGNTGNGGVGNAGGGGGGSGGSGNGGAGGDGLVLVWEFY